MKKKAIGILVFILACTQWLPAQDENHKQHNFSVGLNVSNFVKSFASLNTQTIQTSPYFIVLRYKERYRLHFGFKGRDGIDFASSSGSISDQTKFKFDVKLGIQFNEAIGKRWILQYGLDLVGKQEFEKFTNTTVDDIVVTSVESFYGGISPFLGLQFKINEHMTLLTEADWIVVYGRSTDKLESGNFPVINKKEISDFAFTQLRPPVDLYVIFKF